MLSGSFFTISNIESVTRLPDHRQYYAMVSFNTGHAIFAGHFPGNPIVPGVCQIQVVKEVLECILEKPTRLIQSDNIKFLSIIDPTRVIKIGIDLSVRQDEQNCYMVIASLNDGANSVLKFRGKFEEEKLVVRW